jgi:serine/threonine-protein kinase
VLHRDLKPANIMMDRRGQVIIMDFGLAGLSDQFQGDIRSGTPAYMSPEQLAGTEVTIKSDIYSLGLVLYELFTGKRAFEAASMAELLELQQRGSPVNLTTLVKELDPAVERIVLGCLAPDPKQRPASALSIAAALPGGDPLAAALAAGETPSPELIAAAGETEGLQPRIAVAWLVAALAGLTAVAVIAPSLQITEALHLENPPEALARDARILLQGLGYTARPGDRYWGFEYDGEYRAYLGSHPTEAAARWKNPASGDPALVTFWYRESPSPLIAQRTVNMQTNFTDPPFEIPRMIRLRLDPDGKPRYLEAIPPQVETPTAPGSFDWSKLFQAAGLDMAHFETAEPQWTPAANWDQRAAWTAGSMRVEAAAWRARPVSFSDRRAVDGTNPQRQPRSRGTGGQDRCGVHVPSDRLHCRLAEYPCPQDRSPRRYENGPLVLGSVFCCLLPARPPHSFGSGGDNLLARGNQRRRSKWLSGLGALPGLGTLGPAALAADDDFLEPLYGERLARSPGGPRSVVFGGRRRLTRPPRFAPVRAAQPLVSSAVPRRSIYLDGRRPDHQQHACRIWR